MLSEHSAGAVVFKDGKYLILKYSEGHWDLPKGHIESGESELEAATREIKEETSLDVSFIDGFKEYISYVYRKGEEMSKKSVVFFLAESKSDSVTLSHEHLDYLWLDFEDAYNLITFEGARNVLKKAEEFRKDLPEEEK